MKGEDEIAGKSSCDLGQPQKSGDKNLTYKKKYQKNLGE